MRTNQLVLGLVVGSLVGCAGSSAAWKGGETKRAYYGGLTMVVTNASPADMCSFQMSEDGEASFGDNWLPREGLKSGQSIELRVKPGTYMATWNTCPRGSQRMLAGTLIGERAFEVRGETQLYVFVADVVAPTKRAATRERDYHVVKFPGQAVGGDPTGSSDVTQTAAAPVPATVDFSDVIDKRSARASKRTQTPSLARVDRR